MPLSKDLREFIALLNSNGVEYVVVGAFAVAHHGYTRYTADVDILIRSSPRNADLVLRTLSAFGFGALGLTASDLQTQDSVIQLGVKPNRIDLITSLSGVSFDDVWSTKKGGDLDGIPVNFIAKNELRRNKRSTGRAKDLGDVEELLKRQT